MKTLAFTALALALSVGAVGCQQDNNKVEAQLAEINKKLDAMDKKIAAGGGAGAAARPPQQRRPEPDPKDVYAVPIEGQAFRGAPDALVTIVKAYEYACPYCEKVRPTHDQILKDYDGKVKIVYMDFIVHPQAATLPAQGVCAAHKQGKFGAMEEVMWEKGFKQRKFDEAAIEGFAAEIGLDMAKFKADFKGECVGFVQKAHATLQSFGVGATPAHFINGRFLPGGAVPYPQFKAMIDEELKKAAERGGSPADYYKTWVMDKGQKKFAPKQ